jgi:hypothetical protein
MNSTKENQQLTQLPRLAAAYANEWPSHGGMKDVSMTDEPVSLTPTPAGYHEWLLDLKSRIHTAQQRAALAVNRELVLLYWQIGRDILARQASQGSDNLRSTSNYKYLPYKNINKNEWLAHILPFSPFSLAEAARNWDDPRITRLSALCSPDLTPRAVRHAPNSPSPFSRRLHPNYLIAVLHT